MRLLSLSDDASSVKATAYVPVGRLRAQWTAQHPQRWIRWLLLLVILLGTSSLLAQETIVAIRHAEKPPGGQGQLDCKGLNRALALPDVLIPRFGKPAAIFAPSPAADAEHRSRPNQSYVRPLMTIEPTAIRLGMPVNAQISYRDIRKLQSEVTAPAFRNAVVFVAWEHRTLNLFARQMLKTYGQDPSAVPAWPDSVYDRIYVFRIDQNRGRHRLTFQVEREGLNHGLSDTCPGPAR